MSDPKSPQADDATQNDKIEARERRRVRMTDGADAWRKAIMEAIPASPTDGDSAVS